MTRRSKELRRRDYLDLGAEMVAESAEPGESDPGLALAHVKLADVADRAGVTKGALYHLWPSQEAYWHDLLEYLLESNQFFGSDRVARVGDELARVLGAAPTMRDYSNAMFDTLSTDPGFFVRISLFSYLGDERVSSELDRTFRASVQLVLPVLEKAVASMDRRLVEGSTVWDFAVAVSSLLEGLCLRRHVSPDRTPDLLMDGEDRWSLFAAAAEALLFGYTEPVPPAMAG